MMMIASSAVLAFAVYPAAGEARAESILAKKYDASPVMQGNSDFAMPMHRKKAAEAGMHKKTV